MEAAAPILMRPFVVQAFANAVGTLIAVAFIYVVGVALGYFDEAGEQQVWAAVALACVVLAFAGVLLVEWLVVKEWARRRNRRADAADPQTGVPPTET